VELIQVLLRVISFALLERCGHPIRLRATLDPALFLKHPVDVDDARDALGMSSGVVFFKDFTVVQ
jgi:hypothetical protein